MIVVPRYVSDEMRTAYLTHQLGHWFFLSAAKYGFRSIGRQPAGNGLSHVAGSRSTHDDCNLPGELTHANISLDTSRKDDGRAYEGTELPNLSINLTIICAQGAALVKCTERAGVAMMTQSGINMTEKLQRIIDEHEIYQLSVKYMRGQDRLDRELQRSVYWEDATDDRGFFKGKGWDLVDLAQQILSAHRADHHQLGQAKIEIEGDIAFGEVYFQAFHRIEENGLEKDFWIIGRYVDRYEKRGGEWRIAHRTELNDACWVHPATDDWLRSTPEALRGQHSMEDLTYRKDVIRSL